LGVEEETVSTTRIEGGYREEEREGRRG